MSVETILITGSNGLVGTALIHELTSQGYTKLVPLSREFCNLKDFEATKQFFLQVRPTVVFHTAACVYGIAGNAQNRGVVFTDNILINTHVIEACRLVEVKKIVAMGTVAAYADGLQSPIKEDDLWNGPPHTAECSYGHAKRAMLAQLLAYQESYGLDFAYAISTNLYGPHDRFNLYQGHVIPSLIRKFYEAQKHGTTVEIWGDGEASRDFLYSKDLALALCSIMEHYSGAINVASGKKVKIAEVVHFLTNYFALHGKVKWNRQMPNGRAFVPFDLSRLEKIGFSPSFSLEAGLQETLEWFELNYTQNLIRV